MSGRVRSPSALGRVVTLTRLDAKLALRHELLHVTLIVAAVFGALIGFALPEQIDYGGTDYVHDASAGGRFALLREELVVLAAVPFASCYGLLIGVFAKDQLGAVALTKGLSPVWTSLPILGFVLPGAWLWTQFPFANHWAVQGLFHALGDGAQVGGHAALALATGLPVFAITVALLRRRLGFAR